MDDLLREFLTETAENMGQLDTQLVELERNPNDPQLISSIFRLVHTIKGTCGFIGLPRLEKLAHASENVLGKFRDGELIVNAAAVSLILRSLDKIKVLLATLEATGGEPDGDDGVLIQELDDLSNSCKQQQIELDKPVDSMSTEEIIGIVKSHIVSRGLHDDEASFDVTPPSVAHNPRQVENAQSAQNHQNVEHSQRTEKPPGNDIAKLSQERTFEDKEIRDSTIAGQSIRVSVDQLENLMVIASELVLTRNQLLQILRSQKDSEFTVPLQRLNQVTSELQEGVMKTRMQPIGNAWSKLPRIIRDLSHELGKKMELKMSGAETELDRQVLELIKDPLTHMVRNSADHGIEGAGERIKAGKSETGTISLSAWHEGGHILIEISDDGRGLDLSLIRAKALQNGITNEVELASMSDSQVMQFIFRPGFSTASKVTSVSGRGVGMDVVRTNIEKIGGTVDLKSVYGHGSKFIIKIPLTLAIVSALIVECSGQRFALPQISVLELVHASADGDCRIETLHGTPILRLRERLMPLISLRKTLKMGEDSISSGGTFIIVMQVGASTFGVIVDRVFDTEEIVVKPVSPVLRTINVFSGNTILGDGSVVMILDPNGLTAHVGDLRPENDDLSTQVALSGSQRNRSSAAQALLLFRACGHALKAVPLSLVSRLEEIEVSRIEYSDTRPVVQYRGKLVPLISIDQSYVIPGEGSVPVLVFSDEDRNMGLMVEDIVDIVEDTINLDLSAQKPGIMGSSIINGKSTDVIDTAYFLAQTYHDWFTHKHERAYQEQSMRRILLVDDSAFFRNLLSPLLTVAGYEVVAVDNPTEAFRLYNDGESFDVILSDIEMPEIDGFQFVNRLREDGGRWRDIPCIALSSHATPVDIERSKVCGFNDYVPKFNREGLFVALKNVLQKNYKKQGAEA